MTKIYVYDKCDTCRKALKWLGALKRAVSFRTVPIVEHPPTLAELKQMLGFVGGDVRKLFNASGQVYRELKIGEKLAAGMGEDEALKLLAMHGKLVKRPFLLTERGGAVGFKEAEWKDLMGRLS